jgi:hypothetical protein
MYEKREELPALELKSLPLSFPGGVEKAIKIGLKVSKPIKEGTTGFGEWHLWIVNVENQSVVWGRGKDKKNEEKYSGEALFFPTDALNKQLIALADGNDNVVVEIKKLVEEGKRGVITKYIATKISDGNKGEASLTPTELNLLYDIQEVKKLSDKINIPEETFIRMSQDNRYEGKISQERAKELFKRLK